MIENYLSNETTPNLSNPYVMDGYKEHEQLCTFVNECARGTIAIKYGPNSHAYLPKWPSEKKNGDAGLESYKTRHHLAHYDGIVQKLINEITGFTNRLAPEIKFGVDKNSESPKEVIELESKGTAFEDGLEGLKTRTTRFILNHGRYFLLLDTAVRKSGKSRDSAAFVIREYQSWQILNGEQDDRDAARLKWVLLDESCKKFNLRDKKSDKVTRWRYLGIHPVRKVFFHYIMEGSRKEVFQKWKDFDMSNPPDENTEFVKFKGSEIDFIPATVINLTTQGIKHFDDPPFVDVSHSSIELYNLSSLHMSSLYKNAQTTVVGVNVKPAMKEVLAQNGITGECTLDKNGRPFKIKIPTEMVMGGSLFLEPIAGEAKGDIKLLETGGAGLSEMRASEKDFRDGMRESSIDGLLDSAGANASGESLKMRSETATATFAMIDQNIARAIEQIIVYAAVWAGASWEEAYNRITFKADIRYVDSKIDLNSLVSFLNTSETSRQSGTQERLSWQNLYSLLLVATDGVISSFEDNQSQVESEAVRL